jgi:hypothetical protein
MVVQLQDEECSMKMDRMKAVYEDQVHDLSMNPRISACD